MIIVGITGIIGCGKSTVSRALQQEGYTVIDLDALAKRVSGSDEVKNEIRRSFGDAYIKEDNTVNVELLRGCVFNNKDRLRDLEGIVHPKVVAEMERQAALREKEGDKAVIIDGPLIFETDLHKRLDRIIVVSADTDIIRKRLLLRGMDREDIERRIANQIPLGEKEKAADYVVDNSGTEDDLKQQIIALLDKIKTWEVAIHAP